MKLRMRGATVRLRLTRSEVAQFAETGLVSETVTFPSMALTYRLLRSTAIAADLVDGVLTVSVPAPVAKQWTDTQQVGIEAATESLGILIEKDFQCAHGPADLDTYPPEPE